MCEPILLPLILDPRERIAAGAFSVCGSPRIGLRCHSALLALRCWRTMGMIRHAAPGPPQAAADIYTTCMTGCGQLSAQRCPYCHREPSPHSNYRLWPH
eukprot:COSAG02_NODE_765_length_17396_cov_16.796786_22_plen_99_part_00